MENKKMEFELICKIAHRAVECGAYEWSRDKVTTSVMDIDIAHKHYGLDLEGLFNADVYDFMHDILGIINAINRAVYPATFDNDPLFLPRYAVGTTTE